MVKTRKPSTPRIDFLGVEIGEIRAITSNDLATLSSKGKYDKAIAAIMELEPQQIRILTFPNAHLAKCAASSIGTSIRRANMALRPGKEIVIKMKCQEKLLKVARIQ